VEILVDLMALMIAASLWQAELSHTPSLRLANTNTFAVFILG
jgi:hypothetical protein